MGDTDLVYETNETSREVFERLKATPSNRWVTVLIKVPFPPDTLEGYGYREVRLKGQADVNSVLTTASRDKLYNTKGRFTESPLEFDVTVTIQARQVDLLPAKLSLAPEALGVYKEIAEQEQQS